MELICHLSDLGWTSASRKRKRADDDDDDHDDGLGPPVPYDVKAELPALQWWVKPKDSFVRKSYLMALAAAAEHQQVVDHFSHRQILSVHHVCQALCRAQSPMSEV